MISTRLLARSATVVGAAALAGCFGVAPQSQLGDLNHAAIPAVWAGSRQGQAGVDAHWIRRFGDRRLTALVREALEENRDLRAAAARLRAAEQAARIAGREIAPEVSGAASGRRNKQNFIGFPGAIGAQSSRSNTFGVSLDASWELDIWGRRRAAHSAAIADVQANALDLRAARVSLAAQTAKAWFAFAEAQGQIAHAEASAKSSQNTLDVLGERFEFGLDDGASVSSQIRLAQADLASARAALAARRQAAALAARQIELLLGRHPTGGLGAPDALPPLPPHPPAGLPSGLLQRRPDILAAERRYAAATTGIREAKLALFPALRLTGSTGRSSGEIGDLLNSNFSVWSIGANLAQPILAGGAIMAEKVRREHVAAGAFENLRAVVLRAFGEVEIALTNDRHLALRRSALADALEAAQEAESQARDDFAEGLVDILTVTGAQQRRDRARSQLLDMDRQRLENRVDLHLALGGDWLPRPRRGRLRLSPTPWLP